MICGKCNVKINDKSNVCSECGVRHIVYDENTYSSETMPIAVVRTDVFIDGEFPYINLILFNGSGKTITAVKIIVTCVDPFDEVVGFETLKYIDLSVEDSGFFGESSCFKVSYKEARVFKVAVDQVVFSDGDRWYDDNSMGLYPRIIYKQKYKKSSKPKSSNKEQQLDIYRSVYEAVVNEGKEYFSKCFDFFDTNSDRKEQIRYISQLSDAYFITIGKMLDSFESFAIPPTVEEIEYNYFLGFYGGDISYNYEQLSEEAKFYLNKLKKIKIKLPSRLKRVGDYALAGLTIQKIPSSIIDIGKRSLAHADLCNPDIKFRKLLHIGSFALWNLNVPDDDLCIQIFDDKIIIDEYAFDLGHNCFLSKFVFPSTMKAKSCGDMWGMYDKIDEVRMLGGNSSSYKKDLKGNIYCKCQGGWTLFWEYKLFTTDDIYFF